MLHVFTVQSRCLHFVLHTSSMLSGASLNNLEVLIWQQTIALMFSLLLSLLLIGKFL